MKTSQAGPQFERRTVMLDLLVDPKVWISLFSVTLVQIALGADNLIIITIIANKLPATQRKKAINLGLLLAMVFRILLLLMFSVDLYQNWLERKGEKDPIHLHRRKKASVAEG